jgi:hypothetical protein
MERPDRKEVVASDERNPIFAFHWTAGIGRPATMFWFEGSVLLAGVGTRAEEWLLDRGAIAVGMLRFGGAGAEAERAVPGGHVVPVRAGDMVEDVPARVGRRN